MYSPSATWSSAWITTTHSSSTLARRLWSAHLGHQGRQRHVVNTAGIGPAQLRRRQQVITKRMHHLVHLLARQAVLVMGVDVVQGVEFELCQVTVGPHRQGDAAGCGLRAAFSGSCASPQLRTSRSCAIARLHRRGSATSRIAARSRSRDSKPTCITVLLGWFAAAR